MYALIFPLEWGYFLTRIYHTGRRKPGRRKFKPIRRRTISPNSDVLYDSVWSSYPSLVNHTLVALTSTSTSILLS